ncbi:MAG: hypothetical protein KIT57_18895 [Blastocatellales bacterium]|nr:hypothetical protein [Blastocatellales bacterium]
MTQEVELLRQEEAKMCMASVDDLVVSQLMNLAHFQVIKWYTSGEKYIAGDFDICFFMEVMKEVFSDKMTIQRILTGEDMRWFADDE